MKLSKLSQTSVGELHGLVQTEKQFGMPVKKPIVDKRTFVRPDMTPPPPDSGFQGGNYGALIKGKPRLDKYFGGSFGS